MSQTKKLMYSFIAFNLLLTAFMSFFVVSIRDILDKPTTIFSSFENIAFLIVIVLFLGNIIIAIINNNFQIQDKTIQKPLPGKADNIQSVNFLGNTSSNMLSETTKVSYTVQKENEREENKVVSEKTKQIKEFYTDLSEELSNDSIEKDQLKDSDYLNEDVPDEVREFEEDLYMGLGEDGYNKLVASEAEQEELFNASQQGETREEEISKEESVSIKEEDPYMGLGEEGYKQLLEFEAKEAELLAQAQKDIDKENHEAKIKKEPVLNSGYRAFEIDDKNELLEKSLDAILALEKEAEKLGKAVKKEVGKAEKAVKKELGISRKKRSN